MDQVPPTSTKVSFQPGPRRALGRGLDALLPAVLPAPSKGSIQQIELAQIDPNPHQARRHFHQERLRELSQSIKNHGVVQPVVVRRNGDRYTLIAGERRWRAAALAGIATIPAILRDAPERDVLELTLIENIQREDLNPIETAEAFARLANEAGLTHEQIAERTGKDRVTITNLLRLLRLPIEVRDYVASGKLSAGHARALLALSTESAQKALAARILAQDLSVRQTESLTKGAVPKKPTVVPLPDPNVHAAIQDMERALGTRVRIVSLGSRGSRGKIEIEFYSAEDLERVFEVIVRK